MASEHISVSECDSPSRRITPLFLYSSQLSTCLFIAAVNFLARVTVFSELPNRMLLQMPEERKCICSKKKSRGIITVMGVLVRSFVRRNSGVCLTDFLGGPLVNIHTSRLSLLSGRDARFDTHAAAHAVETDVSLENGLRSKASQLIFSSLTHRHKW